MADFKDKISHLIKNQAPEFVLEDHPYFLDFVKEELGIVSEGKITLNESGTFKIYCPSDKYQANIVILDTNRNRNIASQSESKPSVWVPKDYSE